MPSYSQHSQELLDQCDTRLITLFSEIIKTYDCTILETARTMQQQIEKYKTGLSKTEPSKSKHVISPEHPKSRAVDAAPYPVIWPKSADRQYIHQIGRFYHFAGAVQTLGLRMGITIRWGGDWNSDRNFTDQTFDDLDHFELVEAQ